MPMPRHDLTITNPLILRMLARSRITCANLFCLLESSSVIRRVTMLPVDAVLTISPPIAPVDPTK